MPALLFVILAVEATDLIFALDSIPAVLAISRDPFIVYTSNIFAILGLRSLYFVLAGMLDKLRLLHYGLAVILAFVALKMLLVHWIEVPVTCVAGLHPDYADHFCYREQNDSRKEGQLVCLELNRASVLSQHGVFLEVGIVSIWIIVAVVRATALLARQS